MSTLHVVTESTTLSDAMLNKLKRLAKGLGIGLRWYVLCHNSVGDRRYVGTAAQLIHLWQSYTQEENDKCQVLKSQLDKHFKQVEVVSIFDKHWGNEIEKQSTKEDLVVFIKAPQSTGLSSVTKLFVSHSDRNILILGNKPWHIPAHLAGAIDPFHEDDPQMLADKNVFTQLQKLHNGLAGSHWRVVHSIYVPPLAVNHKKEISSIHREEVARFCRKLHCPNDHVEFLEGRPESTLSSYVNEEGVDLLVVGSRKRGFFDKWMNGSTIESLLENKQMDILLVRASRA